MRHERHCAKGRVESPKTARGYSAAARLSNVSGGAPERVFWIVMRAPFCTSGIICSSRAQVDKNSRLHRGAIDADRGLAEFERDLIRARTGEGRARAVARGQKMGRPSKLTPHQGREAIKRRDTGDECLADIGRSYNVSGATISRLTTARD